MRDVRAGTGTGTVPKSARGFGIGLELAQRYKFKFMQQTVCALVTTASTFVVGLHASTLVPVPISTKYQAKCG